MSNALGQYCYSALLNLGFYKKILYLMDIKSGLCVASMFSDFYSFRQIYVTFAENSFQTEDINVVKEAIESVNFNFLRDLKEPGNEIQLIAMRTALDSIV